MSALGMVGIVRIGSTTPARSIFSLVQSALGKDFSRSTFHLKSLRDSKA